MHRASARPVVSTSPPGSPSSRRRTSVPRGLSRGRMWGLGVAGTTLALLVAGVVAFGPVVRARVAKEGARRHLDVRVGSVRPGFFAVGLKDVRVRLEGVSGAEVRLDDVRIGLTAGLSVQEVTGHGGEIKLEGEPE